MSAVQAAPVHLETARRLLQRVPVVRVATAGPDGPHVVPVWFVWEAEGVFCSLFDDTVTQANIRRDSRVALVFDVGGEWEELAGVVLTGTARPLRPGHPELRAPMSRWHDKYRERFGRHGFRTFSESTRDLWFLRVIPDELAAWDHGAGPFAGTA
ncbi:MAG TPA: pyridoxamine 5'-phosphate oxidase family protein [Actinomycetota bacterium]|nr:pyridoxamine 5'-phosphate oxidase family protein [Actinomycetota bacterium]